MKIHNLSSEVWQFCSYQVLHKMPSLEYPLIMLTKNKTSWFRVMVKQRGSSNLLWWRESCSEVAGLINEFECSLKINKDKRVTKVRTRQTVVIGIKSSGNECTCPVTYFLEQQVFLPIIKSLLDTVYRLGSVWDVYIADSLTFTVHMKQGTGNRIREQPGSKDCVHTWLNSILLSPDCQDISALSPCGREP